MGEVSVIADSWALPGSEEPAALEEEKDSVFVASSPVVLRPLFRVTFMTRLGEGKSGSKVEKIPKKRPWPPPCPTGRVSMRSNLIQYLSNTK